MKFLKFAGALTVTIAMLFGIPVALLLPAAPSPLDDPGGIREIFDQVTSGGAVSDRAVVSLLVAICWILWAYLAVVFIIEVIFTARNKVSQLERPNVNIAQALVRTLVSALMWSSTTATITLGVAGAGTMAVLAAPPAIAQELPIPELGPADMPLRAPQLPAAEEPTITYTLPNDTTLWSLALEQLGDGMRYQDIVDLNDLDPEIMEFAAGTQLELPADALLAALQQAEPTQETPTPESDSEDPETEPAPTEVVVAPGDSIWSLTEDVLGDELGRTPTVDETTPVWADAVQRNEPNLTSGDADTIYPGETLSIWTADAPVQDDLVVWTADIPDVTAHDIEAPPPPAEVPEPESTDDAATETVGEADVARPPSGLFLGDIEAAGEAPAGLAIEVPDTTSVDQDNGTTDAVTDEAGETAEAETAARPPIPASAPAQPPIVVPSGTLVQPDDINATNPDELTGPEGGALVSTSVRWGAILAGFSVLAAGIGTLLVRRRRKALGSRPAQHTPSTPTDHEVSIEAATNSASIDRNTALSNLSNGLLRIVPPDAGAISAAIVDDEATHLIWDTPAPQPLVDDLVIANDERWTIPHDAASSLQTFDAAALPALLTIGTTDTGREVLINLETINRLDLGGTKDDVEKYALRAAIETALSTQAGLGRVICVGFGREISTIPTVEYASTIDEVIDGLEGTSEWVQGIVQDASILDARSQNPTLDVLGDPIIVIDLTDEQTPTRDRLVAAADASQGGIVLITWGDTDAEWAATVKDDTIAIGGTLNTSLTAKPLDPELIETLTKLVDDEPEYEPSPELVEGTIAAEVDEFEQLLREEADFVPPEPATIDGSVIVSVLGKPAATGAYLTGKQLELVALMLANDNKITHAGINDAMYPPDKNNSAAIKKVLKRTREALGETDDGTLRLSNAQDGVYKLTDVGSDLNVLTATVEHLHANPDLDPTTKAELIDSAVQLIDGEPYSGPIAWEWVIRRDAANAIVTADDLCRELGAIYSNLGHYPRAKWAIRQGLKACAHCIPLYETLLDLTLDDNDPDEITALWTEINTIFEDEVPESLNNRYSQHLRNQQIAV